MVAHPSAARLVATTLAAAIRPPESLPVPQWIARNVVLVDGTFAGQLWAPEGAPYLVEIAECLGEDHPCNLVTVRKSQQTGASILALAWALYVADQEPANMLYAVPGIDALKDLNSGKLQPLIDAFQRRARRTVILPQNQRTGTGSTTYEKVFAKGGRLWLANANSVMDLSSKTAKKGVKDEISKWTDIPGYGDPETLFFGRFTAHRRAEDYKILEISTPETDTGDELGEEAGHCRIDRSFKRSDQRYWHFACPACGTMQYHRFAQFRVNETDPRASVYECEGCGHGITESERVLMLRPENGAQWIATAPGVGRHPGFHIDAFMSLMMSYGAIAEDWLKQRGSATGMKDFSNLVLGLPYQHRGDAPDHQRLMDRREAHLERGIVPPEGLLLTAAVDVQMRGVYVEIVAWGRDRRSWVVDATYIDGDTDSADGAVFQRLRDFAIDRKFRDAWGRERITDVVAIDSGYRSNVVYALVRKNQVMHPLTGRDRLLAVKGLEGWGKPVLGVPSPQDINYGGERIRNGVAVFGVGTWPIKSSVYLDMRKTLGDDITVPPAGFCHFPGWLDEAYFKQLCSESLQQIMVRGRPTGKRWVAHGENHYFDCRVYNMAMAEYLGLSSMTDDEWSALVRLRGTPAAVTEPNLFTAPVAQPPDDHVPAPRRASPRTGWFAHRLNRDR